MDFVLRCNSLKCRQQLTERAVVTTCSHIFCDGCSTSLGLTAAPNGNRTCPACQSTLPNPDDAVSTSLNPTDDYKTSVLSGLAPSTIMECAGRGLNFWSYQSTQEIIYQEYLAKSLTNKHSNLNVQMDQIINQANAEIEMLNQKLSNLQIDQDRLKSENQGLAISIKEKNRKCQQTQELYDRLKRKEMLAATQSAAQSAAYESVDESTGGGHGRQSYQNQPQDQHSYQRYSGDHGPERGHIQQQHGGNVGGRMPPPPPPRPFASNAFGFGGVPPTPSNHRTQLGRLPQSAGHSGTPGPQNVTGSGRASSQHVSQPRHPLAMVSPNGSTVNGYGMRAGMKVGTQQSPGLGRKLVQPSQGRENEHPTLHLSQISQQAGPNTYY